MTGDERASARSHFHFFFSAVLLVRLRTGEPRETIVDVTVGRWAYGSTSCLLNGDLVFKVSTGVARWHLWTGQTVRFLNLVVCPSLVLVMGHVTAASGRPAATRPPPVDSWHQSSWCQSLYICYCIVLLLLNHRLYSFIWWSYIIGISIYIVVRPLNFSLHRVHSSWRPRDRFSSIVTVHRPPSWVEPGELKSIRR